MVKRAITYGLPLLLLLWGSSGRSQVFRLVLSSNPLDIKYLSTLDSNRIDPTLVYIKNHYQARGYLAFNFDSLVFNKTILTAYVFVGPKYTIGKVNIVSDSIKGAFRNLKDKYYRTVYDTLITAEMAEQMLTQLENNGYPFARVKVENRVNENQVEFNVRILEGEYFTFDTCHIEGDPVIKKRFLEAYTGIKRGNPFNEALLNKAHEKLNQLPFLLSERNPQIVFIHGGKAKIYYYLKKRKSDQFNGIIGLAPTASTTNTTGRQNVVFTGEVLLNLINQLKRGETININWRSFKARSQQGKASFSYPYILSKPFGADLSLDFVKYDTLYTTFQRQFGLQYYTSGINGFKVFYQVAGTNLNSVDTAAIRQSKQFPAINAIQVKQYGIMGNFNFLDYRFNPQKGMLIEALFSAGVKEIQRDNQIAEIRFGSSQTNLYDSGVLRTTQYTIKLKADKFFRTGSKTTFKMGFLVSQIIAPRIYFNEMLREGGINSLKGFNEQSIFATNFNMIELEYRYLFGLNSYFKLFWNGAYYEDKSFGRPNNTYDTPWGFGAGANIETRAGILSIMYALGKEKSNTFDLRTGKVHFGISSYF